MFSVGCDAVASMKASLRNTESSVGAIPSVLILSRTIRTLSGCCRAFATKLPFPKSSNIRSVPAETKLSDVRTITELLCTDFGAAMAASDVCPVRNDCNICFTSIPVVVSIVEIGYCSLMQALLASL